MNILPAAGGEDSYGLSVCFPEMASVGSSHNRPTSAEDNEKALLLGCPPIGPFLGTSQFMTEAKKKQKENLISPALNAEASRLRAVMYDESDEARKAKAPVTNAWPTAKQPSASVQHSPNTVSATTPLNLNALVLPDVTAAFKNAGWQWIHPSLAFQDDVFRLHQKHSWPGRAWSGRW